MLSKRWGSMSKRETNGFLGIVGILTVGLILMLFVMLAEAAEKSSASGGSAISADTAQGAPGSAFTSLSGPSVLEQETGEFALGSIVLNAPVGFSFNTAQDVTIGLSGEGCDSSNGIDLGSGRGVGIVVTPTDATVTVSVEATTRHSSKCRLKYSNLQVQPTAGTPLASGSLTYSGTSSVTGSAGTLTEVAGEHLRISDHWQRQCHRGFEHHPDVADRRSRRESDHLKYHKEPDI